MEVNPTAQGQSIDLPNSIPGFARPSYIPSSPISSPSPSSGQALVRSPELQRRQFEEQLKSALPGFHSRWLEFKTNFYSQSLELDQADLNLFFDKFLSVLSVDQSEQLATMIGDPSQRFETLDPHLKVKMVNSFRPGDDNPAVRAYQALDSDVQERLVRGFIGHYGERNCLADFPRVLHHNAMSRMETALQDFAQEENKRGFHFLARGSFGAAFRYGIGENQVCVKVSLPPVASDLEKMFQYDEKQIRNLEANRQRDSSPEEYFVPVLVKDLDGEYLGIPDKVLVTALREGKPLFKFTNSMEFIGGYEFFRIGVDDQHLVDFMEFYLRNATAGADLGDIFYNNMLYRPGYFEHIEVAGVENDVFANQTNLRTQNPEAYLLSTVMISVLMIGGYGKEAEAQIEKVLRETFDYDDAVDPLLSFKSSKMGQMFRALDLAIERGIITPSRIIHGASQLVDDKFSKDTGIVLGPFQAEGMRELINYMNRKYPTI